MTIWTIPAILSLLLCVTAVEAAPVSVRLPEGNTRGFLVLRSPEGEAIAHGELRQKPGQGLIESRLSLSFKDGSHREESAIDTPGGSVELPYRWEADPVMWRGKPLRESSYS